MFAFIAICIGKKIPKKHSLRSIVAFFSSYSVQIYDKSGENSAFMSILPKAASEQFGLFIPPRSDIYYFAT